MIPSFSTGGVLTAPPGALITGGYVPGNTLAAQHLNWYLYHITAEINSVLTAGGVAQNSALDNQLATAIKNIAGVNPTVLAVGSPYTVPLLSGAYVITAVPYTMSLPATTGSGARIRIVNGMTTIGLMTITPNGTDKIGQAGNVSCFLQNVDQSGNVYLFQWLEIQDVKAGYWEVTGGQLCPHQTVDTDGQQYHLGKLHHLPLGNTTSRTLTSTLPGASSWGVAISAAGVAGVPSGAKAVRVRIYLSVTSGAAGNVNSAVSLSDNNSNTPTSLTAHPYSACAGIAVSGAQSFWTATEVDIPLNSSGQFYVYCYSQTNLIGSSFVVSAVGYYMGD